ncbi:MAG: transposase [Saprospiraceae bacterium]
MKAKVKHYTDEFKLMVVQEYLNTNLSGRFLMKKYNFKGTNNILNWLRKFNLQEPNNQQLEIQTFMSKQKEKTTYEQELEAKIQKLEEQLEYEKFRTLALNTMIDVAERDLKISIRKKAGTKQ